MDLKEKLVSSFMAFEERVDVHSDLHDIRTNALKKDYENLSGKIKNFITYLNKKDFKGNKFQ